jgi:hypothetical protein
MMFFLTELIYMYEASTLILHLLLALIFVSPMCVYACNNNNYL